MFDRCFVINLRSRPDRLHAFYSSLEANGWPFPKPEPWPAVPGNDGTVPCPPSFTEGGGAFGCRQSHVSILQHCLMEGINSVFVFEDDAFIRPGFDTRLREFLNHVPEDWEGIMLGGQHHSPPTTICDGVVKVNYAQRTHAYVARGEYMRGLYARWVDAPVHIDWLMNSWQHQYSVYAPTHWLVGQARSRSDICDRTNAATFWNAVATEDYGPVFLLDVPQSVMMQLRDVGFHTGYSLGSDGIDEGLREVFFQQLSWEKHHALERWIDMIQQECGQNDGLFASLWHPMASLEDVQAAAKQSEIHVVRGNTFNEAIQSLPENLRLNFEQKLLRRKPIVILDAPKEVVQELRKHGFHTGYWRNPESDIDMGLEAIYQLPSDDPTYDQKLIDWCRVLRAEADLFGGVVAVWHPLARKEHFEAIDEATIAISGETEEQVLALWKQGDGRRNDDRRDLQ